MTRTREEVERLSATTVAILGLLSLGEQSGYDLLKLVDTSIGHFWSPAKSQVYAELRRLVTLGYATERELEQDRRPDKRVYRLTAQGRAALREWLRSDVVEREVVRSPFLLKVFFGGQIDRDRLVELFRECRMGAEAALEGLEQTRARIEGRDDMYFPLLTLRFGLAHYRATVRWCSEALHELEGGGTR